MRASVGVRGTHGREGSRGGGRTGSHRAVARLDDLQVLLGLDIRLFARGLEVALEALAAQHRVEGVALEAAERRAPRVDRRERLAVQPRRLPLLPQPRLVRAAGDASSARCAAGAVGERDEGAAERAEGRTAQPQKVYMSTCGRENRGEALPRWRLQPGGSAERTAGRGWSPPWRLQYVHTVWGTGGGGGGAPARPWTAVGGPPRCSAGPTRGAARAGAGTPSVSRPGPALRRRPSAAPST
jgi:hypothetical protein